MSLEKLAEISRYYGSNPDYVIAGGGNTSFKDKDFLYVKASGTSLAQAKPGDFVKMNRPALAAIWKKDYPADTDAREAAVLADMMAARCPGEEAKRPSVETLLHDILPFAFVVHTHPALVNGLTCSQKGKEAAAELFPDAVWIPSINPGYILSKAVKDAMEDFRVKHGKTPEIIFLQNHGVFAAADSVEGIHKIYERITGTIGEKIRRKPDFSGKQNTYAGSGALENRLLDLAKKTIFSSANEPWFVRFERSAETAAFVADEAAFKNISSAFTPDHIVYSGSAPLFVNDASGLETVFQAHIEKTGRTPKIIAVRGMGVFGLANTEKAAENALELFRDTQKVAVYTESFGGPLFMSEAQIRFINNWEVERYRSKVST